MKYAEWQQSAVHRQWLRTMMQDAMFKDFLSTLDSMSFTKMAVSIPAEMDGNRGLGMTIGYQKCLDNIEVLSFEPATSVNVKEDYSGGKKEKI